jgi:murein DD-endopeptidase MepM/ murein hydrolase activator NlpD
MVFVRRWFVRLALLLAPVGLSAASPSQPAAVAPSQPAAAAPSQPRVMPVNAWITALPAPPTPDDYAPPPGPRVAWPLRGILTQPFGCTGFELERPAAGCPGFHLGLDIAQAQGTPIRAAAPGMAYPLADPERYGNLVVIQHYGGYATIYGHMVRQAVTWGQPVQAGDVIGFVGSTGNSSGPHLHFEVRYAATAYDPVPYLSGSPPDPTALPAGWPGAPRDDWLGIR